MILKGDDTMNDIVSIISNVGFPIACVVFMAWYINNTMKENNKILNDLNVTINKLMEKLEKEEQK